MTRPSGERVSEPSTSSGAIIVLAKQPSPGAVKTRLCPPCSPEQAAAVAEAAHIDTLDTVASCAASRKVLVLEGEAGDWLPEGIALRHQRGQGLAERIAAAFADVGGPALLIGMDTPQLTAPALDRALRILGRPGVDAILGRSDDGGYWAIGLTTARAAVFRGIPMSRTDTGARQRARLLELGLRTVELPRLRDVDQIDDARAVAALVPHSRFAASVDAIARAA